MAVDEWPERYHATCRPESGEDFRIELYQRYVASIDVQTRDVHVQNPYIPSAADSIIRSCSGKQMRADDNVSVPTKVLSWVGGRLRKSRETTEYSDSLSASAPFDEDYTLLGHFEDKNSVELD